MVSHPKKIWLFVPCLVDQFFPEVALNSWRILQYFGFDILYPQAQTCCGQPAYNAGFHDAASRVVRHFLTVFSSADVIVCPSGSCVSMIKSHCHTLKLSTKELLVLERLKPNIFELTEFLYKFIPLASFIGTFPHRVIIHDSCHGLRELGLGKEIRSILALFDGIDIKTVPHDKIECCGFGGIFSVAFAELSREMAADKVDLYRNLDAEFLVSTDVGCLMQLGGIMKLEKLNLVPLHIASLIAKALDIEQLTPISNIV